MRCKICSGIVRTLCEKTRETQTCGYCRGTHPKPTRRPRNKGGNEI